MLILLIAKKYYNRIVGIIAVLVFGASASIIPFERLILLDNIGIVFILAAFLLFLPKPESNPDNQLRISPNPWSGLLVAIAILVKYPFVVFIPGFIIFFYVQTHSTYNLKIKFEFFQDVKRWFKAALLFIVPFLLYLVFILLSNNFMQFLRGVGYETERLATSNATNDFVSQVEGWLSTAPILSCFCFIIPSGWLLLNISFVFYKKVQNFKHIQTNRKYSTISTKAQLWQKFNREFCLINLFIFCYFLFISSQSIIYNYYFIPFLIFAPFAIGIFSEFLIALLQHYFKKNLEEMYSLNQPSSSKTRDPNKNRKNRSIRNDMITISVVCVWMVIVLFPFNFGFLTTNATQFQFDALSWVEK